MMHRGTRGPTKTRPFNIGPQAGPGSLRDPSKQSGSGANNSSQKTSEPDTQRPAAPVGGEVWSATKSDALIERLAAANPQSRAANPPNDAPAEEPTSEPQEQPAEQQQPEPQPAPAAEAQPRPAEPAPAEEVPEPKPVPEQGGSKSMNWAEDDDDVMDFSRPIGPAAGTSWSEAARSKPPPQRQQQQQQRQQQQQQQREREQREREQRERVRQQNLQRQRQREEEERQREEEARAAAAEEERAAAAAAAAEQAGEEEKRRRSREKLKQLELDNPAVREARRAYEEERAAQEKFDARRLEQEELRKKWRSIQRYQRQEAVDEIVKRSTAADAPADAKPQTFQRVTAPAIRPDDSKAGPMKGRREEGEAKGKKGEKGGKGRGKGDKGRPVRRDDKR